ncbi:hypothetical protein Tsp_12913, partial [Trichinella spiralis]|uniref:hypothetical protein n=1 Tax=Trichinella spiralis TaxID=6334 RepID=UPI0001EFD60D
FKLVISFSCKANNVKPTFKNQHFNEMTHKSDEIIGQTSTQLFTEFIKRSINDYIIYFVERNEHSGRWEESGVVMHKQYGRTVEQGARPVSRDVALLTTCRQSAASRKQLSNLT